MTMENQVILNFLRNGMFPPDHKLDQIIWTFEECSKDETNNRYLVSSQIEAIKFEKLTGWICESNRQSADAMTFTDEDIVLIEFKAGDRTKHQNTKEKLIKDVIGKINDSEMTVFQDIINCITDIDINKVHISFYLVVDAKEMGIDSRTAVLLQLSLGAPILQNAKMAFLIDKLLPELRMNANNPDHFSEINIWYSDIFDTYLEQHGIVDISSR